MIDVNTEDKNITSEEAYNYIFKHESFIGTFYNDGVNVTTIGDTDHNNY